MTKLNDRSIDARIAELQELARNCSKQVQQAAPYTPPSRRTAPPALDMHPVMPHHPAAPRHYSLPQDAPAQTYGYAPRHAAPEPRQPVARPEMQWIELPKTMLQDDQDGWMDSRSMEHMRMDHGRIEPRFSSDMPAHERSRMDICPELAHSSELYLPIPVEQEVKRLAFRWSGFQFNLKEAARYVAYTLLAVPVALFLVTWNTTKPDARAPAPVESSMLRAAPPADVVEPAAPRRVSTEQVVFRPEALLEPQAAAATVLPSTTTPVSATDSDIEMVQVTADKSGLPEELTRGNALLRIGDVASARLMFRRAAAKGDPRGAMGMAATYDPNVLQRLPVYGLKADPEKAREWYQHARELGSADATARLEALPK